MSVLVSSYVQADNVLSPCVAKQPFLAERGCIEDCTAPARSLTEGLTVGSKVDSNDRRCVDGRHASFTLKEIAKATAAYKWLNDLTKSTNHPFCCLPAATSFLRPDDLCISSEIGKGAYATVSSCFLDKEGSTKKRLALKRLKHAVSMDNVELRCFLLEAHLLATLKHRNIISFCGFGMGRLDDVRTAFYVMENCAGGSLKSLLVAMRAAPILPPLYTHRTALRWCIELVGAVAYMHDQSVPVIHRDIKLDNCLLTTKVTADATLKLCDFGLAVELEPKCKVPRGRALNKLRDEGLITGFSADHDHSDPESYFDLTGQSGSLLYMAPEVFYNLPYNEKADIYSIGVVMFELFSYTLLSSYVGKDKSWREATKFARGYRVAVPETVHPAISRLISLCWSQDPRKRPSARNILDILLQIQQPQIQQPAEAADSAKENVPCPATSCHMAASLVRKQTWMQRSMASISRALSKRGV